ncbi:MAG: hypothetical protein AB8G05_27930 [Oligoflexales bacterium]
MKKNSWCNAYEDGNSENNERSALLGATIAFIGTIWLIALIFFLAS